MVGTANTMKAAADFAARGGRIVVIGEEADYPAIDTIQIAQRELQIVGSRNGRPWLVLGSRGGPRILSTVLNVLIGVRDHNLPLEQAVANPRFHHQWRPNEIQYEPGAFGDDVRSTLMRMGHVLRERSPWSSAQCIEIRPDGTRKGVSDPRSEGAASGY